MEDGECSVCFDARVGNKRERKREEREKRKRSRRRKESGGLGLVGVWVWVWRFWLCCWFWVVGCLTFSLSLSLFERSSPWLWSSIL